MTRAGYLAVLTIATVLFGCGGGSYDAADTVEVTGEIKIDGKVAGDVEVLFFALGGDQRTSGLLALTDEGGQYTLPEVLPGEYRVQVDRMVNGGPNPALNEYQGDSPLRAVVAEDATTFDFDVTTKK